MNYLKPELAEELAKRYVLGTMNAGARRRFNQLLMQHRSLQEWVWQWEQLLNPMTESLPEITPDQSLWQRITERLGWQSAIQSASQTAPAGRLGWLSGWITAGAALLVAVVIGWQSLQPQPSITPPAAVNAVAVLQTELNKSAWLLQQRGPKVNVTAQQVPSSTSAQDFELWMLPQSGKAPISLGLLPKKGQLAWLKSKMPDELFNAGLAVSVEPKGGSPTGAPTGPVILTANWITLSGV